MESASRREVRTSLPLSQEKHRFRIALCLGSTLASIRLRSLGFFSTMCLIVVVQIFVPWTLSPHLVFGKPPPPLPSVLYPSFVRDGKMRSRSVSLQNERLHRKLPKANCRLLRS